ncbi:MAG: hypothetical protein AAB706_03005 [Patescibacteria group bacterium]
MAAQTAATTTRESLGSLILMIYTFTSVVDADTFASGLGSNVKGFWANSESAETAGDEGVNVTNSAGTFTLNLKTTGAVTLYVLATI